jgi:hypothetical protein
MRPKLPPVAEETSRLSGLIAQELIGWRDVSQRPMCGMRAFYRGDVVFALLLGKRALENPQAIAYKLPSRGRAKAGEKWKLVELKSEQDIAGALACLEKAYRKAGAN